MYCFQEYLEVILGKNPRCSALADPGIRTAFDKCPMCGNVHVNKSELKCSRVLHQLSVVEGAGDAPLEIQAILNKQGEASDIQLQCDICGFKNSALPARTRLGNPDVLLFTTLRAVEEGGPKCDRPVKSPLRLSREAGGQRCEYRLAALHHHWGESTLKGHHTVDIFDVRNERIQMSEMNDNTEPARSVLDVNTEFISARDSHLVCYEKAETKVCSYWGQDPIWYAGNGETLLVASKGCEDICHGNGGGGCGCDGGGGDGAGSNAGDGNGSNSLSNGGCDGGSSNGDGNSNGGGSSNGGGVANARLAAAASLVPGDPKEASDILNACVASLGGVENVISHDEDFTCQYASDEERVEASGGSNEKGACVGAPARVLCYDPARAATAQVTYPDTSQPMVSPNGILCWLVVCVQVLFRLRGGV